MYSSSKLYKLQFSMQDTQFSTADFHWTTSTWQMTSGVASFKNVTAKYS